MSENHFESDANIMICGYRSFSFDKEQCTIFFKGSIHSGNEKVDIEKWAKQLAGKLTDNGPNVETYLYSEFNKISGLFSLVIKNGNDYIIAGDIIRSFPVFYGFLNNDLFITDNLNKFQKQNGTLLTDNDKLEEYISSGFVFGDRTVYKNVYAIQAGEFVIINGHQISSSRYFQFKPTEKPACYETLADFVKAYGKVMTSVFIRMIEQTPNVNRWVVPLSGGLDSRTIVNYLYRLGMKNVICFSYGTPGNEQSGLSKQVAEALGFKWYFIEYTEQKWLELHEKGIIDDFIDYSFNGVSIPHLQDFLAMYELKKKEVLEENDVIVPGHTYDFLAGSNLGQEDICCENKTMAIERTYKMHSKSTDWTFLPIKVIEQIYEKAKVDPVHFQEYFNWQEKRAKFLVNTCRGYEFFGFEVRLPYWDKEIVDFWLTIPDNDRMGRKLCLEAEPRGILVERLVSIPFFGKVDRRPPKMIENLLGKLLPDFMKTLILRITKRKVKYNAGLNQIYTLRASTVKELLDPVEDFPPQVREYFKEFLNRFPYQVEYHFLTSLYTTRRHLDMNKHEMNLTVK